VLRVRRGPLGPDLTEVVEAAHAASVRVEPVDADRLTRLGGPEGNAQGVVLEAGPLPETSLEALLEGLAPPQTVVALDGVEDPRNLGAIARVAEAAGVAGVVLTRRRSAPLSEVAARASAGAVEWLRWARVPNLPRALNLLKKKGFWVFGAESGEGEGLFDLPDRVIDGSRVVVLGAEGRGIRRGVERELDFRVQIPMAGRIASLNVSAAAAVVLFELQRRSETRP